MTDNILIQQYLVGNNEAFETLLSRYKQRIYSFIYSKVKDRELTDDIFQDTFIKVIKTIKNGQYNEEGKFLPWIMRIAHNLVIDFFRKNNRMPKVRNTEEFDIFQFISDNSPNAEHSMVQAANPGWIQHMLACS